MSESTLVKEIPTFLKDTSSLTKPDENAKHQEKLLEIANGFDEVDARVVCMIFARKYPTIMFQALTKEILDLRTMRDDVIAAAELYKAQEGEF